MAEWIYFIHPPRDNFAATMTDEEKRVWAVHFDRLQRLHAQGVMILVGPTLGPVNTGIAIFEAPDEASARRIMNEDPCSLAATPAVSSGRSESRFSAVEMGRVLPRDHLMTAQCYESRSIPSAVTEVSA